MRKIVFALLMLIPLVASAKEFSLCCSVNGNKTDGPVYENDSVRFEFSYSPYLEPYFLKVKIVNKTDSRITVEWENARILNHQVCFRSDNIYTFNNPKPNEVVYPNSSSVKDIGEREAIDYRHFIFKEDDIKKRGHSYNSVILPIIYSSGKVVDYKISLYWTYKR